MNGIKIYMLLIVCLIQLSFSTSETYKVIRETAGPGIALILSAPEVVQEMDAGCIKTTRDSDPTRIVPENIVAKPNVAELSEWRAPLNSDYVGATSPYHI
jgi:hypothetical protein